MKIRVERRGGLAGLVMAGERDDSELTPLQRAAVSKLMKLIDKLQQLKPSPGADRFRYKIHVTDEDGEHEFEVPEDDMPEELAAIAKAGR